MDPLCHFLHDVVVIVVPALVAVQRSVRLLSSDLMLLPLGWHFRVSVHLFSFTLFNAVDQTAGEEGHGHEEDDGCTHNGNEHCQLEPMDLIVGERFAVGLSHPVSAVCICNTLDTVPDQFVFVRAVQRDHGANTGAVSMDDPLEAQGWLRHGAALSRQETRAVIAGVFAFHHTP